MYQNALNFYLFLIVFYFFIRSEVLYVNPKISVFHLHYTTQKSSCYVSLYLIYLNYECNRIITPDYLNLGTYQYPISLVFFLISSLIFFSSFVNNLLSKSTIYFYLLSLLAVMYSQHINNFLLFFLLIELLTFAFLPSTVAKQKSTSIPYIINEALYNFLVISFFFSCIMFLSLTVLISTTSHFTFSGQNGFLGHSTKQIFVILCNLIAVVILSKSGATPFLIYKVNIYKKLNSEVLNSYIIIFFFFLFLNILFILSVNSIQIIVPVVVISLLSPMYLYKNFLNLTEITLISTSVFLTLVLASI